ncbi:hypothetical protein NH14_028550 [Paraburkholderia sacchari]|uniref:Uncharacterized protein n=1 Tax=Paraburkholderia sacchari TaxID=159450 RepID=A0A8T6ZL88_9BURK|nr:hypothetical protein [Paraburkholderia sacchari]
MKGLDGGGRVHHRARAVAGTRLGARGEAEYSIRIRGSSRWMRDESA